MTIPAASFAALQRSSQRTGLDSNMAPSMKSPDWERQGRVKQHDVWHTAGRSWSKADRLGQCAEKFLHPRSEGGRPVAACRGFVEDLSSKRAHYCHRQRTERRLQTEGRLAGTCALSIRMSLESQCQQRGRGKQRGRSVSTATWLSSCQRIRGLSLPSMLRRLRCRRSGAVGPIRCCAWAHLSPPCLGERRDRGWGALRNASPGTTC